MFHGMPGHLGESGLFSISFQDGETVSSTECERKSEKTDDGYMYRYEHPRVRVTVEDNRRSDYPEREVAYSLANFTHANFAHWSFRTNNKPQVRRVKLHVRRATFLRIIYKSLSASATATVIQTDIRFRNGTYVRK